jgi:transposase
MAMIGQDKNPPTQWQIELAELRVENARLRKALAEQTARAERAEEQVRNLEAKVTALEAERDQQAEVMDVMKAQLDELQRMVFGRSSERMPPVDVELRRTGKANRDAAAAAAAKRRKENKNKKASLETERIDHKVDRSGPPCPECGRDVDKFKQVGDGQTSDLYEFVPARFIRRRHYRETLACPCGEHMVTAQGPAKVGEGGGNYGPGFISHVMVSRAGDAIPFNRMEKQFKRLDIPIARATMVKLFHRHAEEFRILVDRLFERIRGSPVVLADETPMKMQRKFDTGKAGKGYFWVFIAGNLIGFRFSPSRSGKTPSAVLGSSKGTLVVDAYTGYNKVTGTDARTRAGCLAHARRKFFKALDKAPEAQTALDFILEVYKVEHDAKAQGVVRKPDHLRMRTEQTKPVMDEFKKWLDQQAGVHPPKSPMGKAVGYALKNWEALTQFLKSEQVPVDNNRSENALRIVALHRKNSLTVGHDEAGENHAVILSLVRTCEANDVNPQEYLEDLLLRIHDWPSQRLDDLLPDNWKRLKEAGELPPIR